jgi:hypothetical protein
VTSKKKALPPGVAPDEPGQLDRGSYALARLDLPDVGDLPRVHLSLFANRDDITLHISQGAGHIPYGHDVLIQEREGLTDRQAIATLYTLVSELLALPDVSEFSQLAGTWAPRQALRDRWHRIVKRAKRRMRSAAKPA